jgi:hypothetical protein
MLQQTCLGFGAVQCSRARACIRVVGVSATVGDLEGRATCACMYTGRSQSQVRVVSFLPSCMLTVIPCLAKEQPEHRRRTFSPGSLTRDLGTCNPNAGPRRVYTSAQSGQTKPTSRSLRKTSRRLMFTYTISVCNHSNFRRVTI